MEIINTIHLYNGTSCRWTIYNWHYVVICLTILGWNDRIIKK